MNDNIPYIDLLCNNFKMQKPTHSDEEPIPEKVEKPTILKDDNEEIIQLLHERLKLGRKTYGHGVIVDQDTRKHGTPDNDWELMALEELLDGLIYTTAAIIRHRRQKRLNLQKYDNTKSQDDIGINYHDKVDYII